jgi:hypothetical protein
MRAPDKSPMTSRNSTPTIRSSDPESDLMFQFDPSPSNERSTEASAAANININTQLLGGAKKGHKRSASYGRSYKLSNKSKS